MIPEYQGMDPLSGFPDPPYVKTEMLSAMDAEGEAIRRGAALLRNGEVVAFPTETVYGLGANGLNPEATKKIFQAKGRPQDNPLILHIADFSQLDALIEPISEEVRGILPHYWPGPMTFIFRRSALVPDEVTAGGETVAVRMPVHPVARALIRESGVPVAAPSANRCGRPSPTTAEDVLEDMEGRIPLILDGGATEIGLESTVLDLTTDPPAILRPGFYDVERVRGDFPDIRGGEHAVAEAHVPEDYAVNGAPKAPGMKYRHYAPKAEVTVFVGSDEAVAERMAAEAHGRAQCGERVGFMVFDAMVNSLRAALGNETEPILTLGRRDAPETMGHRLFHAMRLLDHDGCDAIFVAGVDEAHVGVAVMNRLLKAAGGRKIEV